MEQNQYIVALEIGSSKIVGAIAEKSPSGVVSVNRLSEERMTNCVRHGCILNVENVKSAIHRIVKDMEDHIDGRITQVYVGVSGRSLHSEVSEVNRSLDSSKSITDDIIEQIIRDASRNTIKNYETIDVVPRAYYVDKSETEIPVGQIGSSIKVKVNLLVAKPTIKMNLTRVMGMIYGPEWVKDYMVTALATGEQVLSDSERSLGCMLVDIGAETTTVTIYKKGALIYMATLPLGGRTITRDIMTGANVMEETAERIKQNINNPLDVKNVDSFVIEGVSSKDAAGYISSRTGEIIANIDKQLDYAGVTKDDIRSVVLIGGGALLQGLPQKLEEMIKLKVNLGQVPKTLDVRDNKINRIEYIQVFSLLAKGAKEIAPGETCVERNNYSGPQIDPPTDNTKGPEVKTDETVKPSKPAKPPKPGWRDKFLEKIKTFMTEPEDEDDE